MRRKVNVVTSNNVVATNVVVRFVVGIRGQWQQLCASICDAESMGITLLKRAAEDAARLSERAATTAASFAGKAAGYGRQSSLPASCNHRPHMKSAHLMMQPSVHFVRPRS